MKRTRGRGKKPHGTSRAEIPHALVTDVMLRAAGEHHTTLGKQEIHTSNDGKDAVVLWEAGTKWEAGTNTDYPTLFALANFNSRDTSVKLLAGVRVGEADVPLTEVRVCRHDHYGAAGLVEHTRWAMGEIVNATTRFPGIVEKLRRKKVGGEKLLHLTVEAARKELMPWSRLRRIDNLINEKPECTTWDLLVVFAQVAQMNPPLKRLGQVLKFYRMLEGKNS